MISWLQVVLAAATLAAHSTAPADSLPTGHWDGVIHVAGQNIPMQVDFSADSAGLHGKLDIQGQHGLALQSVGCRQPGPRVHFELAALSGSIVCDGPWKGDSISGDFSQAGFQGRFEMARGQAPVSLPLEPVGFRDEEVRIPVSGGSLAGTLSLPEGPGPHPAVILITGSGPQNRDEEIFGFRPFRILAGRLCHDGLAVLRLDDRGVGESRGNFAAATTDTFVHDIEAALEFLRARADINPSRVGLLGHSEGALVAPMIASKSRDVAFAVLVAGPAVRGDSLLVLQSAAIARAAGAPDSGLRENADLQRRSFAALRADTGWAALEQSVRETIFSSIEQRLHLSPDSARVAAGRAAAGQMARLRNPWMRRYVDLDPAPFLEATRCPVLALFGEFDTQVPPGPNRAAMQAAFARGGNHDATLLVLPHANHLFQPTENGSPSLYPGLPKVFAPDFLDTISRWTLARVGRDSGGSQAPHPQK